MAATAATSSRYSFFPLAALAFSCTKIKNRFCFVSLKKIFALRGFELKLPANSKLTRCIRAWGVYSEAEDVYGRELHVLVMC